jgi:hypothetical protein
VIADIFRLDTITAFEFARLRNLRYLSMNWGLRPCWVESSLGEGVRFVRNFQQLDTLTLVVTMTEHDLSEKELKRPLRVIAARVLGEFASENSREKTWQRPKLRVLGTCGVRALKILKKESTIGFPLVKVT